jgi:membrane associated rhomboid family serine protease
MGLLLGLAGRRPAGEGPTLKVILLSPAISGAMGAYLLLFPRRRIVTRLAGFLTYGAVIKVPSWCWLGFWIALQLVSEAMGSPGTGWWAAARRWRSPSLAASDAAAPAPRASMSARTPV